MFELELLIRVCKVYVDGCFDLFSASPGVPIDAVAVTVVVTISVDVITAIEVLLGDTVCGCLCLLRRGDGKCKCGCILDGTIDELDIEDVTLS